MKRKYSEQELYAFIYRADTLEKINAAAEWLRRSDIDNDLFDDLMVALSLEYRRLSKGEC